MSDKKRKYSVNVYVEGAKCNFKAKEKVKEENNVSEMSIEDKRKKFVYEYKKDQKNQTIISIAFILLILLGLYMLISYPSYLIYTFLGIVICFLGLNTYSKVCSRKKQEVVKDFVEEFRNYEVSKIYKEDIENIKSLPFDSLKQEEIKNIDLFKDIFVVESNNIIEGTYLNQSFKGASVAIYKNKTKLSFIGKYYSSELCNPVDGRIIIHIHNEKNDMELNTIGLMKLSNSTLTNADIYSSLEKEETLAKIKDIESYLTSFTIDQKTSNVCILIDKNKLYTFINYTNDFVDVPVQHSVDDNVINITKINFKNILEISKK